MARGHVGRGRHGDLENSLESGGTSPRLTGSWPERRASIAQSLGALVLPRRLIHVFGLQGPRSGNASSQEHRLWD